MAGSKNRLFSRFIRQLNEDLTIKTTGLVEEARVTTTNVTTQIDSAVNTALGNISTGLDSASVISLINANAPAGGALYDSLGALSISGNNIGDIAFITGDSDMRVWNGSKWVISTIEIPPTTVEYVVVGGGGSSYYLNNHGTSTGGGGAGGYRSSVSGEYSGAQSSAETPLTVNAGDTYTITVGAGGSIGTSASNGENSQITGQSIISNILTTQTITSIGGGHGGKFNAAAQSGGSGGGSQGTNTPGSGTANQGTAGRQQYSSFYGAGAGGSAGAPHPDYEHVSGVGIDTNITGTNLKLGGGGMGGQSGRSGPNAYGGGRAGYYPPSSGSVISSTPGTANTGGGGGGGSNRTRVGNSGGSGVVILRCSSPAASTTGSPEVIQTNNGTVYKFNGSGTITF
jgi:hypothetical protein